MLLLNIIGTLWFTFCWSGYTPTSHWIVIKLLSANRKPYILAYMTVGDAIENDSRSSLAWAHLFWDLKQMIDEINIFFINQNTLPQLKKRFGNLLKKKRNTEYSTMHIFFYCYQRVVFSDIKSKTFIYVRKFKKVPTCLLFLKILNSNSTCPPPSPSYKIVSYSKVSITK